MGRLKPDEPGHNYPYSIMFTQDEKQWLEVLARDDKTTMADEIRRLIFAEKDRRIEALKQRVKGEKMTC